MMFGERSSYYNDCDEISDYYSNNLDYDSSSIAYDDHCSSDRDIVKVTRNGAVIYIKENEPREMTVEEISEALGFEVKVIKG